MSEGDHVSYKLYTCSSVESCRLFFGEVVGSVEICRFSVESCNRLFFGEVLGSVEICRFFCGELQQIVRWRGAGFSRDL